VGVCRTPARPASVIHKGSRPHRPPEVKGDGKNMLPRRLSPKYPHMQSAQNEATQLVAVAMPESHAPFAQQKPFSSLLSAALV
jgi:hypothetical protein